MISMKDNNRYHEYCKAMCDKVMPFVLADSCVPQRIRHHYLEITKKQKKSTIRRSTIAVVSY